ncbi:MAG: ABC transporter ATP-binding protein [Bacilli bacterium]|nr:ABC transporter ATP-binding protein [Bacilli bacterium]MDD3995398.1 ABC transporter ATP-binding protein [Bacilli bacterium]MDD4831890.1 ABC transporter ATP-binding protein [Bacilli bacterium]
MDNIIEIKNLTKKFGDLIAVNNISIDLKPGKIYGFLGPNGAGKTTTMSMLCDLIIPTSGEAFVGGYKIGSIDAKKMLGYSPEFPSFYTDMNCMDYLIYMGELGGLSYELALKKSMELIEFMNLKDSMYKKVSNFSTGMKKKIGLAQAMIHDPKILMLDEPTANLDPTSRFEIINSLKRLVKEKNITLIISSHVLTELELIITDVIMINAGSLMFFGPLDDAKKLLHNDLLIIETSNNQMIIDKINRINISDIKEDNGKLTISTNNLHEVKKELIKIAYENNIDIITLKDASVSLDEVYSKILTGKVGE